MRNSQLTSLITLQVRCDVITGDEWQRSSSSLVVVDQLITEGSKRHSIRRHQRRKSYTINTRSYLLAPTPSGPWDLSPTVKNP